MCEEIECSRRKFQADEWFQLGSRHDRLSYVYLWCMSKGEETAYLGGFGVLWIVRPCGF